MVSLSCRRAIETRRLRRDEAGMRGCGDGDLTLSLSSVAQERFRKLVESDEKLSKWASVPKVIPELGSKEVTRERAHWNIA